MYPGPANININAPAPQFPHPQIFPQPQQQFYPTAYPPHSAGPSPPIPTYVQPQGGQTYQAPQPHTPAPFKKPYLPLQRVEPQQLQYNHNAQSPPPSFTDNSSAQPVSYAPNQRSIPDAQKSVSSYLPSSMTATALSAKPPSAHSTPTSEAAPSAPDTTSQASGLSNLDQQRVDALLHVNNLLLHEVTVVQKAGLKAPPQSPQPAAPPASTSPQPKTAAQIKSEGTTVTPASTDGPTKVPSNGTFTTTPPTTTTPATVAAPPLPQAAALNQRKYIEYMSRLKSNIMFLVSISDQTKDKTRPPYPSHLEPPPPWLGSGKEEGDQQLESLRDGYARLRELWPDWKPPPKVHPSGQPGAQQAQQQQQHQQPQQHAQAQT